MGKKDIILKYSHHSQGRKLLERAKMLAKNQVFDGMNSINTNTLQIGSKPASWLELKPI